MAVDFPLPGIVDIRNPIAGDSFTWAGTEPTAAKKSIVIHATASEELTEDGFTIADYHVNHNGWGGIGVHFVCTKDGYPGRAGQTPGGVQIQYVGDLGTWRAGCLNQNPGRIHIEISGLFTGKTPSEGQLRKVREFIDFCLAPNNILPSLNYPSQVTYHNAVPGQNTSCPGWQYPHFQEWFSYLQGGAEPTWFSDQQPAPVPVSEPTPVPAPEPIPEPVGTGAVELPEYQATYTTQVQTRVTTLDGNAVDMTGQGQPIAVAANTTINVLGSFTDNGVLYYRSDKSVKTDEAKGTWYGLREDYFAPLTGQVPDTMIPIKVISKDASEVAVKTSKFLAWLLSPLLKLIGRKN